MTTSLIVLLYGAIAIQFALKAERETKPLPFKVLALIAILFPVVVPMYCIRHIIERN